MSDYSEVVLSLLLEDYEVTEQVAKQLIAENKDLIAQAESEDRHPEFVTDELADKADLELKDGDDEEEDEEEDDEEEKDDDDEDGPEDDSDEDEGLDSSDY